MLVIEILFWVFLGLIFYNYIGYALLLRIVLRIREFFSVKHKLKNRETEMEWPEVTLFIAAYNEEEIVDRKMANCMQLDYPEDKLHILWVTDGSTDNTNVKLAEYKQAEYCFSPQRKGKVAAFNHGMEHLHTPFVVFCDANTDLNKSAIKEIMLCFVNPVVGCVAGEKRVNMNSVSEIGEDIGNRAAKTEGIYWKYESFLKETDARFYSAVGAAGELFAIRTELYEVLPEDTLLDDFVLSLKIAMRGYKIDYCKRAYASESSSANMHEEAKRKVRIAAGGWQSVGRLLPLLNIFKYGSLSFLYISHRVMRWCVSPFLLLLLLPLNIILVVLDVNTLLYSIMLILQMLFYVIAICGFILSSYNIKQKYFYVAYYFLFMNINVFRGIGYLIKNKGKGTWQKAKRA